MLALIAMVLAPAFSPALIAIASVAFSDTAPTVVTVAEFNVTLAVVTDNEPPTPVPIVPLNVVVPVPADWVRFPDVATVLVKVTS